MDAVKSMEQALQRFLAEYHPENSYEGNLMPTDWKNYYDFISWAYQVPQGVRPTVSDLAARFQDRGIPKPGSLAMLYAHGIYILARYEGKPIFKEGINY